MFFMQRENFNSECFKMRKYKFICCRKSYLTTYLGFVKSLCKLL